MIGADCTLGHGAIVHGATLGDRVLIGIHASVLNGAVVADDCIVAAGALVPEGKEMPAGSLVMGVPGKVARPVSEEERTRSLDGVQHYLDYAQVYRMVLGEATPLALGKRECGVQSRRLSRKLTPGQALGEVPTLRRKRKWTPTSASLRQRFRAGSIAAP